jgi:hypothetical protein
MKYETVNIEKIEIKYAMIAFRSQLKLVGCLRNNTFFNANVLKTYNGTKMSIAVMELESS